jgi:glycosyltransferase involved in cell wall biosynthesis
MPVKYVFWQNMPTHLQAPWLAALAQMTEGGVIVALEGDISEERRNLGWGAPDYGLAVVEVGLSPDRIDRIIAASGPDAIHIFSGLGAYKGVYAAFRRCVQELRHVGIMAEASPVRGLRGLARVLAGQTRRLRFGGAIKFILAIGDDGGPWFQRLGFGPDRIYEFSYFPPFPTAIEQSNQEIWAEPGVRLLYIGQFIHRKGIDRLFEALSRVRSQNWSLCLIGAGPDEPALRVLAHRLLLSSRVRFCPPLDNAVAMSALAGGDVLILPSRFDGYGAVINEALSRGVPVICSDQCGARLMVRMHVELGSVFHSTDSLTAILEHWIAKGRKTPDRSHRVRQLSSRVAPESGAAYFLEIVSHVRGLAPRPTPPWRDFGSSVGV